MFSKYFATALLIASSIFAAPTDDFGAATITTYDFNGSGCPPGSSVASLNSDNSVSASFSSFTPSVDGPDPATTRQNCQAVIAVQVPAGQQFTLDKVNYNGFVQLDSSVVATHAATYYFQAELNQNTAAGTSSGPLVKNVDYTSAFTGTPIWSPCGVQAIINVDIAVALRGKSYATGFASVDDAKIGPFTFRSC